MYAQTNYAPSKIHLERSAEAFYDLGIVYSVGEVAPTDYVSAHCWFNLAAISGLAEARELRAEVAAELSASEIAKAQRMARDWLKTG